MAKKSSPLADRVRVTANTREQLEAEFSRLLDNIEYRANMERVEILWDTVVIETDVDVEEEISLVQPVKVSETRIMTIKARCIQDV